MSKVIIFPTDTVYGIGCPIFDLEGIDLIYNLKHRSKDKPLACLCYDLKQIESIAILNERAIALIEAFLPGPLTLILKTKPHVKTKIGYETIGVRIPNHPVALQILQENGPMLTTSVNESGAVPLNTYEEIKVAFGPFVKDIFENHYPSSNISSTVVSLKDDELHVLREGSITMEQMKNIIHV